MIAVKHLAQLLVGQHVYLVSVIALDATSGIASGIHCGIEVHITEAR